MDVRRRIDLVALAITAVLLVTGCHGGDGGSDAPSVKKAAEPGRAPALATPPAGRVVNVGALPQGIVYDAKTRLLAVAVRDPFRLLLLDPTTLNIEKSVPLPGKVRHLQLARPGGPVLVPVESANQIIEVSLPGGTIRTTDVQRQPHDAAGAANGDVVVGNEFSGSISIVNNGSVMKTFHDLLQPGGVVTSGHTAAVIDVKDYTVTTYDLLTLARIARTPAGRGPTHGVITRNGRLAVTDTRGGAVLLFDLNPLRQIGKIATAGRPYGITNDPRTDTVWVTLITKNRLLGIDVSGPNPRVIASYPTVRQADTVAVAPGGRTVWITGTVDGTIQHISR